MNGNNILAALLASPEAAAAAPVNQYGPEFFSQSPAARLESLKMQQSREGELDPTGKALMALLSRRVPRESGEREGATSAMPLPPQPQKGVMGMLQELDPLAPLRTQQYQ